MNITDLKERHNINDNIKTVRIYTQFMEVLSEIKKKDLTQDLVNLINASVDHINSTALTGRPLEKYVKEKQKTILKQLEKELNIVPKNHYRNLWMLFGISGFGIPIGVAFGLIIGNIGLLGIGIPIGMAIGMVAGISMDKKALNAGRQLNVDIKY